MLDSLSTPSDEEKILADFMAALEKDGPAAIDAFAAGHPGLADEFRSLAAFGRQLHQSREDAEATMPERLGEFRIVRRIGRGGMGEIYEAVQDRLKRRVAVKVVRQGKISSDSRARFLREQTVLARLHQTHIVPIHTAGEHGPLQYFAMPYIEGATLSEIIQSAREMQASDLKAKTPPLGVIAGKLAADSRQRAKPPVSTAPALFPLSPGGSALGHRDGAEGVTDLRQASDTPPSDHTAPVSTTHRSPLTTHLSMDYFRSAAQVLADAAMALHHAHAVQILHRDLKPSNIMVDKWGQCWIIDFGLAGYVNQQRESNLNEETIDFEPEPITSAHIKGTPQYMAPEQFDGQSEVRTDVWGLGVTLYELCTLRRAFDGRSHHEISRKIQLEEPMPLRQLVPNLPADLAAICRKAMHKDAGRRYPTSQDFADDLNRWLRHEPVRARPTNALRRAWLWSKRNKGWAAAIWIAILAFLSLGLFGLLYERAQMNAAIAADRQHQRESLILQIEAIRLLPHVTDDKVGFGWSDKAWDLVTKAAESGQDELLRDRAAATLVGLDARCTKEFDFSGSSVAFNSTGERLLIGGTDKEETRLCDKAGNVISKSGLLGPSSVFFGSDGSAFEFVKFRSAAQSPRSS
jgi:serine/threonine protein kinase